jgi:hypothetical protein
MPDQRGVNKVERSLREGSKVGLSGMREKIGQVGAGRTMAVGWLGNEEISETQYSGQLPARNPVASSARGLTCMSGWVLQRTQWVESRVGRFSAA